MSIKYFTYDENEPIDLEELGYSLPWSINGLDQGNDYDDETDFSASEGDYDDGWG